MTGRPSTQRAAYTRAGVDVAAGERAVELMRAAVEATHRHASVLGGLGGFGAAVRLPPGMVAPLLVSSTDGVGTKTAIAMALHRFDTIGIDLVAMCADDVVCSGAAPLFFLDYVAVGRLVPQDVAELVASVARGCELAGCALVGGETAEHPGLMEPGTFDLAGCCVGVVEEADLLDGSAVATGDALLGLGSSGLHSNGFSLVRALVAEHDLDLGAPYQEQLRRTLGHEASDLALAAEPEQAFATLGEVLLTPTRIYAPAIIGLRATLRAAESDLHGVAHVTGGGLPGNVPRVIPEGLAAVVDPARWPMPSVMRLFGALAGLGDDEVRATFNGGLGMVVAVPAEAAAHAMTALAAAGIPSWVIGEVVPAAEVGGRRYAEMRLDDVGRAGSARRRGEGRG